MGLVSKHVKESQRDRAKDRSLTVAALISRVFCIPVARLSLLAATGSSKNCATRSRAERSDRFGDAGDLGFGHVGEHGEAELALGERFCFREPALAVA